MSRKRREKLVKSKVGYLYQRISIFSGNVLSDIATNYVILKSLALNGPTHTYQLWKRVVEDTLMKIDLATSPDYRTIERHLETLKLEGYIQVMHSERTHAGVKETYGLTPKGVTIIESFHEVTAHFSELMNWAGGESLKPLKDRTLHALSSLGTRYPEFQPFAEQVFSVFSREILNRRDFESLTNEQVDELRYYTFWERLLARVYKKGEPRSVGNLFEMLKKDPELSSTISEIKTELKRRGELQMKLAELL